MKEKREAQSLIAVTIAVAFVDFVAGYSKEISIGL